MQRFNNDAKACSKLQHPNTVQLIDFGQTREGLLFMAMEFLDGQALRSAIDRGGRMPPARVLKILIQCCQSLAEAHGLGIIHRDLKPDNLYLVTRGASSDFLKVLDFSVAKLKQQAGSAMQTQAGVVFGTPNYMSPEQGRGLPLDARSDIYALGIVAYEMLMGRPPFMSQNPMEVLAMHVRSPVPPLQGTPDRIAQIVLRSLAKEPAHRQQTVQQLEAECAQALSEMGIPGQVGVGLSGSVPVQMNQGPPPAAPMPGGGPPPAAPPMQHASPQQKTLFAGDMQGFQRPPQVNAQGQQVMPPPPAGHGGPGPGGGDAAKTMIAGGPNPLMGMMPPPQVGPRNGPMAPATVPAHTPQGMDAGNPKTVLLNPSDGIVSIAGPGAAGRPVADDDDGGGPSAIFWIICIVFGVGLGIGAFMLIRGLV